MISKKLLDTILHKEDMLSKRWVGQIRKSAYMKCYQQRGNDELIRRNKKFFEQLSHWIHNDVSHEEIEDYFEAIGAERYREGFPLPEIIYGVFLAKKVLYDVLVEETVLDSCMEIYQVLELITMIYNFFDQGNFNITRGYLQEMCAAIGRTGKLNNEELSKYFLMGPFKDGHIHFV